MPEIPVTDSKTDAIVKNMKEAFQFATLSGKYRPSRNRAGMPLERLVGCADGLSATQVSYLCLYSQRNYQSRSGPICLQLVVPSLTRKEDLGLRTYDREFGQLRPT